jgi:glucosyl-dolichyl phosphate glucuronosyltransferase
MYVSVAICTWNRAKVLDRTLKQLCRVHVPAGLEWELLVVENNCTDETPAIIRSYEDRLPIARLVEPVQGLSHARNRALRAAHGDLVIFTDDDVLVDEDWLAAYVAAANRWPDASYFGGIITPLYESELPPWFRANEGSLSTFVGEAHDLGGPERLMQPGESPWGGSMAFRRKAFEHASFRVDIGRNGKRREDRCDEVFCAALEEAGHRAVWVAGAKLQHVGVPEHLTLDLVRRNYVGQGVTRVRLADKSDGVHFILGVSRWLVFNTARLHVRYVWQRLTRNPGWFLTFTEASRSWGTLSEQWRRRKRRNDHGPTSGAAITPVK